MPRTYEWYQAYQPSNEPRTSVWNRNEDGDEDFDAEINGDGFGNDFDDDWDDPTDDPNHPLNPKKESTA